jgi:hypothetical protein
MHLQSPQTIRPNINTHQVPHRNAQKQGGHLCAFTFPPVAGVERRLSLPQCMNERSPQIREHTNDNQPSWGGSFGPSRAASPGVNPPPTTLESNDLPVGLVFQHLAPPLGAAATTTAAGGRSGGEVISSF